MFTVELLYFKIFFCPVWISNLVQNHNCELLVKYTVECKKKIQILQSVYIKYTPVTDYFMSCRIMDRLAAL